MDHVSLADSLMNPQVINLVLIMTVLYTFMVLHMIVLDISGKMSNDLEFSDGDYIDRYVADHTLMIRGINPTLDVDVAKSKILTLFSERFPRTKLASVHVLRKHPHTTPTLAELTAKLDHCKHKLREVQLRNDFALYRRDRVKKRVPRFRCCPVSAWFFTKQIEAED